MNAFALSLILAGQCPGGVCPAPQPSYVSLDEFRRQFNPAGAGGWATIYEWKEADNCETHLYAGKTCVGGFDGTVYRQWNGKAWSEPCQCPVDLPKLKSKAPPVVGYNGGIDVERMKDAHAPYSINGVSVSGAAAHEATGGGALDDDSGKPWIVVRTDDQKLGEEIRTGLAPLADGFRICQYPPGHWALKRAKADAGLLMVRSPDGQDEPHRQDDFQGGAPAMLAAVKLAIPGPDLRKTPSLPGLDAVKAWFASPLTVGGFTFPVYGAVIAGVFLFLFLRSRRK